MKTLQVVFVSFLLLFSIHLSAQPTLDWQQTFNGGSNLVDKAVAIVHDNSCNTIVVIASDSLGQGVNIVTLKYDENGNLLWQLALDGPDHLDDVPTGLTVDQNDNIYVCGRSQSAITGYDFITMKYNADGTTGSGAWPVRYNNTNSSGNGYDGAESIIVNSQNGDVYVGGESANHFNSLSLSDPFIIHYSGQGQLLDTVATNNGGDMYLKQIGFVGTNKVFALVYDANGNFMSFQYDFSLVSASSYTNYYGTSGTLSNVAFYQNTYKFFAYVYNNHIYAYKVNGNNGYDWNHVFMRSSTSYDAPVSVAVDNSGNSYYASHSQLGSETDVWILKLDANGDTLWSRVWGAGNGVDDIPVKIVATSTPSGIVVSANTTQSGTPTSVLLSYDASGNLRSGYPVYSSVTNSQAEDLTVDNYGNMFIAGYYDSIGSEDGVVTKYQYATIAPTLQNINGDSLYVQPAGASYQWFKDGTLITNEASQGLNAVLHGNGNYSCEVEKYCSRFSSDTVTLINVGQHEEEMQSEAFLISTYKEGVEVTFKKEMSDVSIFMYDTQGRLILSRSIGRVSNGTAAHLDLPATTSTYFLKVKDVNREFVKRIVTARQ